MSPLAAKQKGQWEFLGQEEEGTEGSKPGGRPLNVSGSSATSLCIKRRKMPKRSAATSAAREKEAASRDAEAFDDMLAQVCFCCLNKRLLQCM
jgi:hypothetical protein